MRFKFTLILILLNAAAIGFLYYQEYRKDLALEYRQASPSVLPDAIDIHRMVIEIQSEDIQEIRELERVRDEWQIIRPFQWPANDNAVQRILNQLRYLQRDVTIPLRDVQQSGQTLADFGLENPQFKLTYWSGSGESTLKIGSPTRMGRRLYLLPPDSDEILVVDQDLLQSIALPLENLRSQRVFDIPIFDIRSLVVQTGDSRLRLERRGDSSWYFETPIQSRASDEQVRHTLNLLTRVRALRLPDPARIQADPPDFDTQARRVSIGNGNRRQTLVLGQMVRQTDDAADAETPHGRRYARLEGPAGTSNVFEVDAAYFEWLDKALEELREPHFMRFDTAKVKTMEITQGEDQIVLQRLEKGSEDSSSQWQVLGRSGNGRPDAQPGDRQLIEALLGDLRGLEAQGFVSDAPSRDNLESWGLDPAEMKVKIDGQEDLTLLLGKIGDKAPHYVYAKLAHSPFVYEVRPRIYTQVHADSLHYRLRVLETFPSAARVLSLHLSDLEKDKKLYDLQGDGDATSLQAAIENQDEDVRNALDVLIKAARDFPVRNYLFAEFEAMPGLPWAYRMDVEILLPGGEQRQVEARTFYFSQRDEAMRQVAGSPETGMTFTLTQAIIDALYTLTVMQDPPALPDTPAAIEDADPNTLEMPDSEPGEESQRSQ